MTPCIAPYPGVPSVWRISSDPTFPGPVVGVMGSVHGNEPCGDAALRGLLEAAEGGRLPLGQGTIVLILGNPEALAQRRRFTAGGTDLNRLFDFRFVTDLPRPRWTTEHHRAAQLEPILASIDALLDLHSATAPTPPFSILNDVPASRDLAERLGLDHATEGWSGPGLFMDRVSIGVMQRHRKPALSVECGQHDDPSSIEHAHAIARRFLMATGHLRGEAPRRNVTTLRIVEIVGRPSETFRFVRPMEGLMRLEAGEVLAKDTLAELRVRMPCWVLMPNDGAAVGDDMVFLCVEAA
jgi:predicted deacylase